MVNNLLRQYFPMLPTRAELLVRIQKSPELRAIFNSWRPERQEEFLDFCTGERGLKILYDCFFKEVFNPEYAPERLEDLLEQILRQKVRILQVLPNDSVRIADETSLLITDIVVELADHSIANVEVQKIGYKFPGQRSACYSADLLLRQYKRIRSREKEKFSYKDIESVYTIVFFEKSESIFHAFPEDYLHFFSQQSDTGLQMNLLQKYYFIPLDIFRKNIHNRGISTKLDAWLVFLTSDEPERIAELLEAYPEFKRLYEDIYELCRNVEDIMGLFSKELRELDRNTVQYMIDEMQEEIDASQKVIEEQEQQLEEKEQRITEQGLRLEEKEQQLAEQGQQLEEKEQQLSEQTRQLMQQELENQLYGLLGRDGRLEDLGRAVSDAAYRKKLLEEYRLNL